MTENLENEWTSPGHRLPLKEFFAGQLAPESEASDAGTVTA